MTGQETKKLYALDLDRKDWAERLVAMNQPGFRADQIVQWLWRKHVYDVDGMTNLSKSLRDELNKLMDFSLPVPVKEQRSSDGTRKYLWRFRDGQTAESVLMKHDDRLTACVSTQVGCPLQCVFCATGLSGYVRNLSAGEIAAQFLVTEKAAGRDLSNVVYMGMGEPFLNTDNVLKSVRMLNDEKMRGLGIRNFTISTAGVIPGIKALAASGLRVRLAVSLHSPDEELRGQLMPISQKYPTAELRRAMDEYQETTGDRITIEYALFGGVNDGVEDARALVRYLRGLHVFINLIPFNAVGGHFEKPAAEAVLKFRKVLDTAGFETELRRERGADIEAACGQLRLKTASGEPCRLDSGPGFKPGRSAPAEQKTTVVRPAAVKTKAAAARPGSGGGSEKGPSYKEGGGRQSAGNTNKKTRGKPDGKTAPSGEKRGESREKTLKQRKTGEPEKTRYRSGKKKEERPAYTKQQAEKRPERESRRQGGEAETRRAKAKRTQSRGATASVGKKKPGTAPKTRTKKKR